MTEDCNVGICPPLAARGRRAFTEQCGLDLRIKVAEESLSPQSKSLGIMRSDVLNRLRDQSLLGSHEACIDQARDAGEMTTGKDITTYEVI